MDRKCCGVRWSVFRGRPFYWKSQRFAFYPGFFFRAAACLWLTVAVAEAEISPAAIPPIGYSQLRILDPALLELTLITTKNPDPAAPTTWNFIAPDYTATLPPASEFAVQAGTNSVSVTAVGFKRRPLYAPLKTRDLRIENHLYLRLASPIADGQTVTVKNPSGKLWTDPVNFAAVADAVRLSPVIHVNQVGYAPSDIKKGRVGLYLGSLGEMPIGATAFSVINSTNNQVVFSGSLVRRLESGWAYTPGPYQQVYEADFSNLTTPGEYRLTVPGLGASFPFFIREGVAATFARTLALGLYHQRCGGVNQLPFTRFEHGVCHAAPAQVPDMTFQAVNQQLASMTADYTNNARHTAPQLKDVNSSLYPFVNTNAVDVSLGHHDAGDYSKYTINSAALIHHLVFAADNFPGAAVLDNLGLPESGDGKSDLLQEAKWEADFLSKMQDADGGFYFLVYPRDRAYEEDVLPDHGDPQVVFPKTTSASAAAVAALAEIASSPTFKQQFPTESAAYLQKARLGWSFLTNAIAHFGKDGSYQKITHYGDEFMHDDELAWAAAAIFVATGDASFQQQLIQWYTPGDPQTLRWTWWRLFEGFGCATRTYAFAVRSGRLPASKLDQNYLARAEAEINAAANDIATFAEQNAYGASFPTANKAQRVAGWFFSRERAFDLLVAQLIAPQSRHQAALQSNIDYEAGANPVNMPYVTGLGWRRWHEIVHQYAQNDYRVLPPSGLPLGNIQAGFSWLENYKQELGNLCYPPDGSDSTPYPFYDRWGDSYNTTTEFTIVDLGRSLATACYRFGQSSLTNAASLKAVGSISGLPQTVPAGQAVTATFSASGVDLSTARIVWEARDQEPFIGSSFSFAAKNPGDQWVEVEAQLADGNRVFSRATFSASAAETVPPNSFQSKPVDVSSNIIALYHLDDLPTDATGNNASLALFGAARFDSLNLGWMSNRSGAALHFSDLGDKATVTIPAGMLYSSAARELTLEAMVYINAYKGWNRASARLLSLEAAWNASLEWIEDIYSGPHIRGGTQFDLSGTNLTSALPLRTWFHLSITVSPAGYSLRVNGQTLAEVSSSEFANWNSYPASLELGNFDGWMDEVVIRNSRPSGGVPASPSAPSAQPKSPMEIALSWTDNSTNEAGFRIYRSLNDTDFQEIATTTNDVVSFTDSNLSPATTYFYGIASFNTNGESAPAVVSAATPSSSGPQLNPPSGLAAAASNALVQLTWNTATNATSYNVKRAPAAQGPFVILTNVTQTNYTDRQVQNGTTYFYVVSSVQSTNQSADSAPVSAAPQADASAEPPTAPDQLTATAASRSRINLAWQDRSTNETGFEVERSTDGTTFVQIATVNAGVVTYADRNLSAGRVYYYRVRAVNAAGPSSYSNINSARTRRL